MIEIYTDGSCLENPGNGGWAAIINDDGKIEKISGSEKNTTNNRMELMAPINALKNINSTDEIEIYTDSQYVKLGITEWINTWIKNNQFKINKHKINSLIKGYEKVRKFTSKEKRYLNILCLGSAFRYLLTRLYDFSNTPKTALIKIKDPKEYYQKLLAHKQLKTFKNYLN